jgi:hypothetical protein
MARPNGVRHHSWGGWVPRGHNAHMSWGSRRGGDVTISGAGRRGGFCPRAANPRPAMRSAAVLLPPELVKLFPVLLTVHGCKLPCTPRLEAFRRNRRTGGGRRLASLRRRRWQGERDPVDCSDPGYSQVEETHHLGSVGGGDHEKDGEAVDETCDVKHVSASAGRTRHCAPGLARYADRIGVKRYLEIPRRRQGDHDDWVFRVVLRQPVARPRPDRAVAGDRKRDRGGHLLVRQESAHLLGRSGQDGGDGSRTCRRRRCRTRRRRGHCLVSPGIVATTCRNHQDHESEHEESRKRGTEATDGLSSFVAAPIGLVHAQRCTSHNHAMPHGPFTRFHVYSAGTC